MPISFMDFVNQSRLSTSPLFINEDGDKLKSESSFSYFSFAKRADENNRTVAAFLNSIRNDPNYASFYSSAFDKFIRIEVAEGKPLTSSTVECMHKILERKKAEDDIEMTKIFIANLQKNGIISGELAEKLEKYAIENSDLVKGGNIDTVKAFLSRYFKSQRLFEVVKPLYFEEYMYVSEDKRAAFESYLESSGTLQEAIDKAFQNSTLEDLKDVKALLQPTIREAHEKIKPFLEALNDADARKLASEINNPKVIELIETMADAIKSGTIDKARAHNIFETLSQSITYTLNEAVSAKKALYSFLLQDKDTIGKVLAAHPYKEQLAGLESYAPFLEALKSKSRNGSINYEARIAQEELEAFISTQIDSFITDKQDLLLEYEAFISEQDEESPSLNFILFYSSRQFLDYMAPKGDFDLKDPTKFVRTVEDSIKFVHDIELFLAEIEKYAKEKGMFFKQAIKEIFNLVMEQTEVMYTASDLEGVYKELSRFLYELENLEGFAESENLANLQLLNSRRLQYILAIESALDAANESYQKLPDAVPMLMDMDLKEIRLQRYKLTDQKSMSRYMLEYCLLQGINLKDPESMFVDADGELVDGETSMVERPFLGIGVLYEQYQAPPTATYNILIQEMKKHVELGVFPDDYQLDFTKVNPYIFKKVISEVVSEYRKNLHKNESIDPQVVSSLIKQAIQTSFGTYINDSFSYILDLDLDKQSKIALMQTVLATGIQDKKCIDLWASLPDSDLSLRMSECKTSSDFAAFLPALIFELTKISIEAKDSLQKVLESLIDPATFYRGLFVMLREYAGLTAEHIEMLDKAISSESFENFEKVIASLGHGLDSQTSQLISGVKKRIAGIDQVESGKERLRLIQEERNDEEIRLDTLYKSSSAFCLQAQQLSLIIKNDIYGASRTGTDVEDVFMLIPDYIPVEKLSDISLGSCALVKRFFAPEVSEILIDPMKEALIRVNADISLASARTLTAVFNMLKMNLPDDIEESKIISIVSIARDSILRARRAKGEGLNLDEILKAITGTEMPQWVDKKRLKEDLGIWLGKAHSTLHRLGQVVTVDSAKELLEQGISPQTYLKALHLGRLTLEDLGTLPELAPLIPLKNHGIDISGENAFYLRTRLKAGILPEGVSPNGELYHKTSLTGESTLRFHERLQDQASLIKDLTQTISSISRSKGQSERLFQALQHGTYAPIERYFKLMDKDNRITSYSIAMACDQATGNVHIETNFIGTGFDGVFRYTVMPDGSYMYDAFDVNLS